MSTADMLAEFARVGMTTDNCELAKARHFPGSSPHVRFATAEVIAILRSLPTAAGPLAIRAAFEDAIAQRGAADAPDA